jgi:hypothetical protein
MSPEQRSALIIAVLREHFLPDVGRWRPYLEVVLPTAFRAAEAEAEAEAKRALLALAKDCQFGPCWCNTIAGWYCVGQKECKAARKAVGLDR